MNASRHGSPDHTYYAAVNNRHDGKLAAISVARQFARRCYHILRNLDPDVVYRMPGLTTVGCDGRDSPRQHHGSPPRSLLPMPCPPALGWTAF